MSTEDQVQFDIQYVRGVLENSRAFPSTAPAVLYLWAAIVFVGFLMMDYGHSWFWPIGGLGGGFISMWLNRRAAESGGQIDRSLAIRANLHWGLGLAGGILLSVPLQIVGLIDEATNGQIAILIVAICYFMAGVHLDRFMFWVAALAVVAYALTFFLNEWVWTIPGGVIATGLALAGVRQRSA